MKGEFIGLCVAWCIFLYISAWLFRAGNMPAEWWAMPTLIVGTLAMFAICGTVGCLVYRAIMRKVSK